MPFMLDPQINAGLRELFKAFSALPPLKRGDAKTLRENLAASRHMMAYSDPVAPDVGITSHKTQGFDAREIELFWFCPKNAKTAQPGPALVYYHGGGMISGDTALYAGIISKYVQRAGVPVLSVDYRLAPEHQDPIPVEDCYAALLWLHANARDLGVSPSRIGVMGDSAGGGLAAGVSLLARDRQGPKIALQILIYPMLDDRTLQPDPLLKPFLLWDCDNNFTGWISLLGERLGTDGVSPYAAPARADDLANLPNAYIEAAALDIFRDEGIDYAKRLAQAGANVELQVLPGCPHGFDILKIKADVIERAWASRCRVIQSL